MSCKNCKHYEAGLDGKPGVCLQLIVADIWNGFNNLTNDGIGYSDEKYEKEVSVLYVGEDFECKHFKEK